MKSLKDIAEAIKTLPLKAFDSRTEINSVIEVLNNQAYAWRQSPKYVLQCKKENEALDRRRDREAVNAARRYDWAKRNLEVGMFIKVTGTRDGQGIREVLELTEDQVVCRQWNAIPAKRYNAYPHYSFGDVRKLNDEYYITPNSQMTTHGYEKVLGKFDHKDGFVKA